MSEWLKASARPRPARCCAAALQAQAATQHLGSPSRAAASKCRLVQPGSTCCARRSRARCRSAVQQARRAAVAGAHARCAAERERAGVSQREPGAPPRWAAQAGSRRAGTRCCCSVPDVPHVHMPGLRAGVPTRSCCASWRVRERGRSSVLFCGHTQAHCASPVLTASACRSRDFRLAREHHAVTLPCRWREATCAKRKRRREHRHVRERTATCDRLQRAATCVAPRCACATVGSGCSAGGREAQLKKSAPADGQL
jgi:hypothetical protein